MKLVSIAVAAKLFGVDPVTLRRHETSDGCWTEMYGHRIRVYRIGFLPSSQRRYDEDEIRRVLVRLQKAK